MEHVVWRRILISLGRVYKGVNRQRFGIEGKNDDNPNRKLLTVAVQEGFAYRECLKNPKEGAMVGATGRRHGQSEELIAENILPSAPKRY